MNVFKRDDCKMKYNNKVFEYKLARSKNLVRSTNKFTGLLEILSRLVHL
jgi:hypothetical protein